MAEKESANAGYLFGFNARIGRLHYFLSSVLLGDRDHHHDFRRGEFFFRELAQSASLSQMKWPLIAIAVIFGLASLTLNSMRFRDIGWDPVCVVPLWDRDCRRRQGDCGEDPGRVART